MVNRGASQRVGTSFRPQGRAIGQVALEENIAQFSEGGVVIVVEPGHHETICRGCQRGLVLTIRRGGVDAELGHRLHAVVVEHSRINPGAAAVLSVGPPGNGEPTAGQTHHLGLGLRAGGGGVDAELCTHLVVVGVEALRVDSRSAAVGARVLPHHHIATIAQLGDGRLFLVARHRGVDHLLQPDFRGAVHLGCDIDGHAAGFAGTTVAIGQPDRDRAAGYRVRRGVTVSQRLYHLLHRLGVGAGVELHREPGAVDTVAGDRADRHAAIADCAARNTHLSGSGAFVADAQLVLAAQALQAQLVQGAVPAQVIDVQQTTGKVGRIGIEHADAGIDDLRSRVDLVLSKRHAGCDIHQCGVALADQAGGLAEHLLDHVVAGIRVVVIGPTDDEISVVQPDDHWRRRIAVVDGVDPGFAVHADAIRIELLHTDRAAIVESDCEAPARQSGHRRLVFVARRFGVDAEFRSRRIARCVVTLTENAVGATAVLAG